MNLVPVDAWGERGSLTWYRGASGPASFGRQPGCFASGESPGIIRRGKFTFPLGCSRAFLVQKPTNFPSPQRGRRSLFAYPNSKISPIAGPGSSGPWRRSGGAQPPASSSHPLTTRAQKKSEPKRFAFSSAQGLLYRRGQDLSNTILKCGLIGKSYSEAGTVFTYPGSAWAGGRSGGSVCPSPGANDRWP